MASSSRPVRIPDWATNVGGWPLRTVQPGHPSRDYDYYASKDRAMAAEATAGLMIWDGKSRGTLLNILRLLSQRKPVVVYLSTEKRFTEVRARTAFDKLTASLDQRTARRLHEQAESEGLAAATPGQSTLGF